MSWDRFEGNWDDLRGKMRQKWGKLTGLHLDGIKGRREQLATMLQDLYGISRDESGEQIHEFENEFSAGYEIRTKSPGLDRSEPRP